MKNIVEFQVSGRYALFTDPLTRIGGEKYSYQIPTYEALKGILSSVYWKPTLVWVINKVRVMKAIKTQPRNMRPIEYQSDKNSLAIYTYLADVVYQVQAHFEWNLHREDMVRDRNDNKHYFIAKRMIERGGRRDVFLGTRECQGYVEECTFGEGTGFYDTYGELSYDLMFHGFDYPDETGNSVLRARFWRPRMQNGVIEFVRPDRCDPKLIKTVRNMAPNLMHSSGFEEPGLLDGFTGGEG